MAHTIRDKDPLLNRIRRIKGQAEALERALESEASCDSVLQQIASIRGAMNGLMAQVLEGHVREHLASPTATPAEREKDAEVVMAAIRSYLR